MVRRNPELHARQQLEGSDAEVRFILETLVDGRADEAIETIKRWRDWVKMRRGRGLTKTTFSKITSIGDCGRTLPRSG